MRSRWCWLDFVAGVAAVGSLVILASLLRPLPGWNRPASDTPESAPKTAVPSIALALDDYRVIWQRDWRQPLFDAPPTVAAAPAPSPPPSVELLGTIIEPGRRFALLRNTGRTHLLAEGDEFDGFSVSRIDRGKVRLTRGDESYDLLVRWYEQLATREVAGAR